MTRQMATRVECERKNDQQLQVQDNILSQIEISLAHAAFVITRPKVSMSAVLLLTVLNH